MGLRLVDACTGTTRGTPARPRSVLPVAWVGDDLLVGKPLGGNGVVDTAVLVGDAPDRVVLRVEPFGSLYGVTVASDLLADGAAPVHRPEPRWPLTTAELAARSGLIVGAVVLALLGVVSIRRRSTAGPSDSTTSTTSTSVPVGLLVGGTVAALGALALGSVDRRSDHAVAQALAAVAAVAVVGLVGAVRGRARGFWIGVLVGAPVGFGVLYLVVLAILLQSGALA